MTHVAGREDRIAQLRPRRKAVGFTRGQLAAGMGLPLLTIHRIEQGTETDASVDNYEKWLTHIEGWSANQRAAHHKLTRYGSRFAVMTANGKEL